MNLDEAKRILEKYAAGDNSWYIIETEEIGAWSDIVRWLIARVEELERVIEDMEELYTQEI